MLERARWLAEVTAVLPNTSQGIVRVKSDNRLATANSVAEIVKPADATVLSDEAGRVVYRWGGGIDITKEPAAEMMLSEPLSSWRLRYYSAMPLVSPIRFTGMYAAIAGLAILLIALGVYVLTRLQRQIRLAKNRVTFAGLVSHELRTPLTNIILYTELAKEDLIRSGQPASGQISTRLAVIDIESRRLSRLVSGVMEIIREDTRARPPRMESHHADTVIDAVVSHFVPSFDAASIRIDRKRGADAWLKFDADCLEMILVNLLSNVEKYASSGGHVEIGSSIESDRLVVQIGDHGPGIATRYRGAIFKPFRRIDDSVSAPSGTGIGLTIARRVARRHGGDVRLVASPRGACFEVTLTVKATKPRGDGVEGAHGDDRCN
jgi:signal transduction histidine kinase